MTCDLDMVERAARHLATPGSASELRAAVPALVAEVRRLRAIETAARAYIDAEDRYQAAFDARRATPEGELELARRATVAADDGAAAARAIRAALGVGS